MTRASVVMPRRLADRLRSHAEQAYPAECCGFLLGVVEAAGRRVVLEVEAVANEDAAGGLHDRYRISPRDYLRVDREARANGRDILGCYHSHPDVRAVPSAIDRARAWPHYLYLILAVRDGHADDPAAWMLDESSVFTPVAVAID